MQILRTSLLIAPLLLAAPALADEPATGEDSDLRSAVEGVVGAPVHGDLTLRYRYRHASGETDQDLYQYMNVRVGSEREDALSATFFFRTTTDLDRDRDDKRGHYVFDSLSDSYEHRVNAKLYTAFLTWRPDDLPVERFRVGRQYVYAGETFHIDGIHAQSQVLMDEVKLKASFYGGVPVHLYESSPRGDWVLGTQLSVEPVDGTRAAVDYARVRDDLVLFDTQRTDWAALSVWQDVGDNLDLYGQLTYLEDATHDYTLRATWRMPDEDFMVQGSYYRLLEQENEFATEFDPYYSVVRSLERYHLANLRAVKGFGEHLVAEAGASVRNVGYGGDEGAFNRDVHRYYVTGTLSDYFWDGGWVTGTAENWSGGDGVHQRTFGGDIGHQFGKRGTKVSIGTDFSLYDSGPLGARERNDVRTYYARLTVPLGEDVKLDLRHTWEKDDVETFRVFYLTLTFAF